MLSIFNRRAGRVRGVAPASRLILALLAVLALCVPMMAQEGGGVVGPAEPSSRMMAWKWTTPRRWYSATLAYEMRT